LQASRFEFHQTIAAMPAEVVETAHPRVFAAHEQERLLADFAGQEVARVRDLVGSPAIIQTRKKTRSSSALANSTEV
jgi:hypothetical protein